jgi:5-methylthioadenosine/S-adenosylhomocysteine deaminase
MRPSLLLNSVRAFLLWAACAALFLPASARAQTIPVDHIWSARYVITMDPQRRVIGDGAVAVRAERIVAVGTRAEIESRFRARQRIRMPQGVIAPGFINTHTHAAMSLLRGVADDVRLQEWLEHYIFPAEAQHVSPDFVLWGTRLACLEMLLAGTTTFADMYYFEEVVAQVAKEAGMRAVPGQTIIGFPVADAKTPDLALQRTERFLQQYRNDPLITPAVAPHALYTNSEETLRAARALANRYGVPLLIHLSETRREADEAQSKFNQSPTAILQRWGVLEGRTVAAHGIWLSDSDIGVLAKLGTGIAHCPSSNTKLASGIAPVTKLLAAGVAVGLGTDGPAGSNNDFNLMEEMDLAAKMQKVFLNDPQALPATTALEMATLQGARVLGLQESIGSLEVGKLADLIAIDLSAPHNVPLYNVVSQLVYAAKASDVRHVMVHGKQVVRDRTVLTLSAAGILEKARQWGERIRGSLQKKPQQQ